MRRLYKVLLGFLVLVSSHLFAQCPPNIGFEDGTFNNWVCEVGGVDPLGVVTMTSSSSNPFPTQQTMIGGGFNATDPYGHFPMLCPNGSKYSIKLGNDSVHAHAERVSYTFTVPPGSAYSLVLNYAVVLQNPPHVSYQQPRFTAFVYDVTDNQKIECPAFDFIASASLPGFNLSDVSPDTSKSNGNGNGNGNGGGQGPAFVYYKDWSATTINLVGYGGKVVRLEFTTNDCTLGGHFGYAYLDIDESCTQAITGNTYCTGQTPITLHAPKGFYDYFWYTGDLRQQVGHGETLTIDPAPPDQTKYALAIVPYPGLGCPDTLYTVISQLNTGFKLKVVDTVYGCVGSGADLTAASVTAGSSSDLAYSYFTDPVSLTYLYHPAAVTTEGLYYIQGVNPEGCMNILPVYVSLHSAPVVKVTDPPPVQYPRTVDLTTVYQSIDNQTYSYFSDAKATIPLTNYKTITATGRYYIRAVNNLGCEVIAPVNVQINPPPPYIISGPNVFTPNNDGINDYFMVKIDGFVKFGNLKIFNRNGQLLFTAKTLNDLWNGNYDGHPLPTGTYYWVFEGTDEYYHTRVIKGSSISIER